MLTFFKNKSRYALFKDCIDKIEAGEKSIHNFSGGYNKFGIHINDDNSVTAKEWAPAAQEVYLTGDFSEQLLQTYTHSEHLGTQEVDFDF